MSRKKRITAAALIASAAVFCLLLLLFLKKEGYFLPEWIGWQERSIDCRSLPDYVPGRPEEILLSKRKVTVVSGGNTLWQSEKGVLVQDVLWCDIDKDGDNELLLLCWKRGRFGTSRPFWITEDKKTWSQHIFIYEWKEGRIAASWMASDIGREAEDWSFDEESRLSIRARDGEVTRWDWFSFGLEYIGTGN